MKIKTKSKKVNKAWLADHINDPYVKLAQREGYRARAAYKLKEIDEALVKKIESVAIGKTGKPAIIEYGTPVANPLAWSVSSNRSKVVLLGHSRNSFEVTWNDCSEASAYNLASS